MSVHQIYHVDNAFSPAFTFSSGQVFRWKQIDGNPEDWLGITNGNLIRITGARASSIGRAKHSQELAEIVPRYFSIDDDLNRIFSTFPREDLFLRTSISEFPGLRLLTQDPWECLISFVCSINCNIPSIRMKIENLCIKYGESVDAGLDEKYHSFPTPSILAKAGKSDLLSCKLGFRWKYIKFIAKQVDQGRLDLERISSMTYWDAINELISVVSGNTLGVGPKVADCALLYSFHKKEAFPLDVWMLKYVRQISTMDGAISKSLSHKRYFEIGEAMRKTFGINAGYAQLYIYEKIRQDAIIQNREPA